MKTSDKRRSKWPMLVIVGIVIYVALDILLAHLRPDYSSLHNAESDYGRGPYFWIMDINFLLRCAFSLALVKALWNAFPKDKAIKKASYWLVSWALGSGLLAFFADDPYGYPHTWSGPIHLILAFIVFISVLVGMVSFSRGFRNIPAWRSNTALLTGLTVLAFISVLLLGRAGIRPHSLGGLYERLFLGSVLAWEAVVAFQLRSDRVV